MQNKTYQEQLRFLGNRLRRLRTAKKQTAEQLANALRTRKHRWQAFEAGTADITLTQVVTLATYLGIEYQQLVRFLTDRGRVAVPA